MGNPSVGQNKTPAGFNEAYGSPVLQTDEYGQPFSPVAPFDPMASSTKTGESSGAASSDAANEMATKMASDEGFLSYLAMKGVSKGEGTEEHWSKYKKLFKGYASGGKVNAYVSGGEVAGKGNIPTQPNGDDTLATLKTGEVVLTQEQQAALGGDEAMAQAGVPGFGGNKPADNSPIPAFNQGGVKLPYDFSSGLGSLFPSGGAPAGGGLGNIPVGGSLLPPAADAAAAAAAAAAWEEEQRANIATAKNDWSAGPVLPQSSMSDYKAARLGQDYEGMSDYNIATAKNDWDKGFVEANKADKLTRAQDSMDLENSVASEKYDRTEVGKSRIAAERTAAELAGYAADETKDNVGFDRKRNKDGTLRRKWDALSADDIMKAQKVSKDTAAEIRLEQEERVCMVVLILITHIS